MNNLKDNILNLDIEDIIKDYIPISKKGKDFKAVCPFHDDKSPSMSISPNLGIYKCFSCGAAGNAIKFVMEYQRISYFEALKEIAKNHSIHYETRERTDKEIQLSNKKDAIITVNDFTNKHFQKNLVQPPNALAYEYALNRWSDETIKTFELGYAPDEWHNLKDYAKENSIKTDILLEADLLKQSKDRIFDSFRGRLIFPIKNKYGRTIGFTGRFTHNDNKKYRHLNTGETKVFKKGNNLFGLNLAYRSIKEKDKCYLVEGNPDVMRLHETGVTNVIAPLGTALTDNQINQIKKLTKNVVIISDNDDAGIKATKRSAELFNTAGMFVFTIIVPGENQDPDSYFKNKTYQEFVNFENNRSTDYIENLILSKKDQTLSPSEKTDFVNEVFKAITNLPETTWPIYEEIATTHITPKKLITDRFKELRKDMNDNKNNIPEHVKLSDYEEYGFYIDEGVYFFNTKSGAIRGSNFLMTPLFHVQSNINVKRLFEVENIYGVRKIIELAQKDLIALSRFNEAIEGLGNFLFEGGDSELRKLKRFLYAETETCTEIIKLGWQRKGFMAWSNGILNGKFTNVDKYGIASYNEENYYLPAHSQIFIGDEEELFANEKKFIHMKDNSGVTLNNYLVSLTNTFGDNAKIAFSYLVASLFRDIIFNEFKFFPILNLFGFKGSGKTEMGESLLHFFHALPVSKLFKLT